MAEYNKEDFKAECDRRRNENLIVKGKTYDIKEQIKELGGIWDSKEKQWLMPDQSAVATCHEAMGLGDGPPPVPAPDKAPAPGDPNFIGPVPEQENLETGEMPF